MIQGMTHNLRPMDPSPMPQRLDLELSARTHDQLTRLSLKTGRSISDLAAELLCQAVADQEKTSGSARHSIEGC